MSDIGLKISVRANLPWLCLETPEGYWIGVCEPLKLTVESETWADLMQDIGLTLDAMLQDLLSTNELEKFLREQGWEAGEIPSKLDGPIRFDVPFTPAMMEARA
jgi:hypothetical protein